MTRGGRVNDNLLAHVEQREIKDCRLLMRMLDVLLEIAGGGEGEGAQPALDPPLQMLGFDMVQHVGGFLPTLHFTHGGFIQVIIFTGYR